VTCGSPSWFDVIVAERTAIVYTVLVAQGHYSKFEEIPFQALGLYNLSSKA
jgi:hypothetical protein